MNVSVQSPQSPHLPATHIPLLKATSQTHSISHATPAPTQGIRIQSNFVTHVSCGESHTLLATSMFTIIAKYTKPNYTEADGSVYAWGSNKYGQLGLGNNESTYVPVQLRALAGQRVTCVAAGWYHSCALTGILSFDNDHIYCE